MTFTPTIPSFMLLSWGSQAEQYPPTGKSGIDYFPGVIDADHVVDCLLYRDEDGALIGILNHYSWDSGWERTGNVNIWVRIDHQREGIGTALLDEAARRWTINLDQQRYTPSGAAFAQHWLERSPSRKEVVS